MEVEFRLDFLGAHVDDDGVSSVVSSSAASTDIHIRAEEVSKLSCKREMNKPSEFCQVTGFLLI